MLLDQVSIVVQDALEESREHESDVLHFSLFPNFCRHMTLRNDHASQIIDEVEEFRQL